MKNAIISLFLLFFICSSLHAQVDTPFFYTNGKIYQTVTYGNKLYVGGSFTSIGYSNPYFAVGNLQGDFKQGRHQLNGIVHCSASDGAGGWFIGGDFTKAGIYNRNYFAHLDSAGRVTPLDLKLNGKVRSLWVYAGQLYVAGFFTRSDTLTRNYVLRVNLANQRVNNWNANIQTNSSLYISHIEATGNRVYISGKGNVVINGSSKKSIFAVDTISGSYINWSPNLQPNIYSNFSDFAVYGSQLVLFGAGDINQGNAFNVVDSVWGTIVASGHKAVKGTIDKVSISGHDMLIAGDIDSITGVSGVKDVFVYNFQNKTFYNIGFVKNTLASYSNVPDPTHVNFNLAVLTDSSVFLSGYIEVGSKFRNTLHEFYRNTGQLKKVHSLTGQAFSLTIQQGQMLVGGNFLSTGGFPGNRLAVFDLNTMLPLGSNTTFNNTVLKILPVNGKIYVSGMFDSVNNLPRKYITVLDTVNISADTTWNPSPDSVVVDMAYSGISNKLYVSGTFRNIAGVQRRCIAALHPSTGAADGWNPNPRMRETQKYWAINSLAVLDSFLFVSGTFDSIAGQRRISSIASFKLTPAEQLAAFGTKGPGINVREYTKLIFLKHNQQIIVGVSGLLYEESEMNGFYLSGVNPNNLNDGVYLCEPDSGKVINSIYETELPTMMQNLSYSVPALHIEGNTLFAANTYHESFPYNPPYSTVDAWYADSLISLNVWSQPTSQLKNGANIIFGPAPRITTLFKHKNYLYTAVGMSGRQYYLTRLLPSLMPITHPNLFKGYVYIDTNSDAKMQKGERKLSHIPLLSSHYVNVHSNDTSYRIYVDSGKTVSVRLDTTWLRLNSPHFKVVPDSSRSKTFSGYFHLQDSVNFALQPKYTAKDMSVDFNYIGARVGRENHLYITIRNKGTVKDSGWVTLELDTQARVNMQQVTSRPTFDTIIGNTVRWKLASFSWPDIKAINFSYTIGATVSLNKMLRFTTMVTPVSGDTVPVNNFDTVQLLTRNSYDPNMKEVTAPLTLGNEVALSTPQLDYTIHFQNTGNDVAFKVEIADTLSEHLDLSTLLVTHSSHNYAYKLQGRVITFTFDNINLPDSFRDEPGSHGFVSYTVQPKPNLVHATEVLNTAYIYFDLNTPIITNTTLTRFVSQFTSLKELHKSSIKVYPNPFSGKAVVQTQMILEEPQLMLYDLQGRVISIQYPAGNTNSFEVDAGQLSSGTYILKLTDKTTGYFAYSRIILNR
jgi:uncharacterized repeat protein (TIGR01451 family)